MLLKKQKMLKQITLSLIVLAAFIYTAPPTQAQDINYNYLISDQELTDYTALRQTDIKNFLVANESVLKNMFFDVGEDKPVSATEIIYRAAQEHKINPKFLLALIEKEQSLVSGNNPSQRAIDFATGYGCFTGANCLDRWKGFPKQINSAAAQFRYYIENIDEYNYQPGKTTPTCNDNNDTCMNITPANVSTAALYVYTPHIHGNELFKLIWDKFFTMSGLYPDGSILQAKGEEGVWLIQDGLRRPFTSKAAFVSRYSEKQIILVNRSDLDSYTEGKPIEFAAFTLVKIPDGTIYLLTENAKRKIISEEVFKTIGFNPEEVEPVTLEQVADIPPGSDITMQDIHPTGALVQNNITGGVYYVENAIKYALLSRELMLYNFPKLKIFAASPAELDKYDTGNPVLFKDGALIKATDKPEVYVVSKGERLKIVDEKTFNEMGFKWSNIVATNQKTVDLHPLVGELKI